jgi:hypothetical protein
MIDEQQMREVHRRRMAAWSIRRDESYENEVVERAASVLNGDAPRPLSMSQEHHLEEIGACLECDALAVIEELEEDES